MNDLFEKLNLDVFRLLTANLSLFEYLSLSATCKSIRQLCILDLKFRLNVQPSPQQTFGTMLLDAATCKLCNYVSWSVFNGCCPHPWECVDCARRGPKELFMVVELRAENSDTFWETHHPVCRYGCNFVCNICDRVELHGDKVSHLKGYIICNSCYISFFVTKVQPKIKHLYPQLRVKRVSEWENKRDNKFYPNPFGDSRLWTVPMSSVSKAPTGLSARTAYYSQTFNYESHLMDPFYHLVKLGHCGSDGEEEDDSIHSWDSPAWDFRLNDDSGLNLEWNQFLEHSYRNSFASTIGKWIPTKLAKHQVFNGNVYHDDNWYYGDFYYDDTPEDYFYGFESVEPYLEFCDTAHNQRTQKSHIPKNKSTKHRHNPRTKGINGVESDQSLSFIPRLKPFSMKPLVGLAPSSTRNTQFIHHQQPFSTFYPNPQFRQQGCSFSKHSRNREMACDQCILANDPNHATWRVRKLHHKGTKSPKSEFVLSVILRTRTLFQKLKARKHVW